MGTHSPQASETGSCFLPETNPTLLPSRASEGRLCLVSSLTPHGPAHPTWVSFKHLFLCSPLAPVWTGPELGMVPGPRHQYNPVCWPMSSLGQTCQKQISAPCGSAQHGGESVGGGALRGEEGRGQRGAGGPTTEVPHLPWRSATQTLMPLHRRLKHLLGVQGRRRKMEPGEGAERFFLA